MLLETAKNSSAGSAWTGIDRGIIASGTKTGIIANQVLSRAIRDGSRSRSERRTGRRGIAATRMSIIDSIDLVVTTDVIDHIITDRSASSVRTMLLETAEN
jgi:hypothetical protein